MTTILRIAGPEHGAAIGRLVDVSSSGLLDGIDWADLGGQWVVALINDEVAGCAQLLPGRPFGRAENLCVDAGLSAGARGRVARLLINYSIGLLRMAGCQAIVGMVSADNEGFARALSRRGFSVIGECRTMYKGVA